MPDGKPCWQFTLRHFLFGVIVAGPVLGFLGPPIVRGLFEWSPDADVQPQPVHVHPNHMSDAGYYESAETPLD